MKSKCLINIHIISVTLIFKHFEITNKIQFNVVENNFNEYSNVYEDT